MSMEKVFKVNPAPPPPPPLLLLPPLPLFRVRVTCLNAAFLASLLCFRIKTKDNVLKWDRVNHLSSIFVLAVECWVGFVGCNVGQGVSSFAFWDVTTKGWVSRCMLISFYVNVLLTYPATFLVMRDQVMGIFMPHSRFDPFDAAAVASVASSSSSRNFKTISTTHHAATADPEYVAMVDDDATSSVRQQSTSQAPQSKSIRARAEQRARPPAWFCWIHPQDTRRHTILLTLMLQALVCTFSLLLGSYRRGLLSTRSLFSLVFALYIVLCKIWMNVKGEHVGVPSCARSSEPSISLQRCTPSLGAIFIPYNDDGIFCYQTAAGAYTQDIILATVIFVLVIGYFLAFFKDNPLIVAAGVGIILMVVFIVSMYFLCTKPFAKIVEGRYGSYYSYTDFLGNPSTSLSSSSQEIPLIKRKDITIPFEELTFEAVIASGAFGIVSKYRYFGNIVAVKQVSLLFCLFACHICHKFACNYIHMCIFHCFLDRIDDPTCKHTIVCVCVCRLKNQQAPKRRMKLSNWRSRTAQTSCECLAFHTMPMTTYCWSWNTYNILWQTSLHPASTQRAISGNGVKVCARRWKCCTLKTSFTET
jgi:hypothetical protein